MDLTCSSHFTLWLKTSMPGRSLALGGCRASVRVLQTSLFYTTQGGGAGGPLGDTLVFTCFSHGVFLVLFAFIS